MRRTLTLEVPTPAEHRDLTSVGEVQGLIEPPDIGLGGLGRAVAGSVGQDDQVSAGRHHG